MNTIRKRLSAVKGGRFAELCAPAQVFSIVLSDILGDPLDMIASGPGLSRTAPPCAQAQAIVEKYGLDLSPAAQELLRRETPKSLSKCDDADHRQCAGALHRRRCRLPGAWL